MCPQEKTPKHVLSLVIPSYKQEKTIKKDITRISKVMRQLHLPHEIIVVVDGKLDKTESVLKKARIRNVKIVGYLHNHGKGYAVRYGMSKAKGDVISFLDAGMDLNPSHFQNFLKIFFESDADIVIGSKLHPLSNVSYPWQRKILSWGYRTLVKLLFGLSVSDTQVGMKVFKRKVLEVVFPRLLVKQFAFDIEILAVAYSVGYKKILECPIELRYVKWSSVTSKDFWKIILRMLWDTLAVFYRLKILNYYSSKSKRKWTYDPELNFRINIG